MALRTRPTQFPELGGGRRDRADHAPPAASSATSPASRSSPTRRSSAATRSPTSRASTRTACIKNPLTYEIMTPQSVGLSGSQLTIGKLSGRRGLQGKLAELGHDVEGEALDAIYRQAIALADAKKEVTDADLLALVEQRASRGAGHASRSSGWSVTSSPRRQRHRARVTLTVEGEERLAGGDRQRPGQRAVRGRRRGRSSRSSAGTRR